MEFILINEKDNVKVSLSDGHKYAVRNIENGEPVIKYGFPIGRACSDIKTGEKVHSHNLKTDLSGACEYSYAPSFSYPAAEPPKIINAFLRKNGDIGIRNDIWIIPSVGCVNKTAAIIAEKTGAIAFSHPYGCSQLGADLERARKTLAGLITHPNAGGVLVLGLGCENNRIGELKAYLGSFNAERIRFLNAQDVPDEIAEGAKIVEELKKICSADKREPQPISKLKLGLKCGGSDAFSGIIANPMVGRVCDRLVSMGGAAVLTEVPEMFGAEKLLFERCVTKEVFDRAVEMVNGFKDYFIFHGQPVSENPSPGNKDGGITTLEEKSLGCIQKGGFSPVEGVLFCGEQPNGSGLWLLDGPGNDIVSSTNLSAAHCHAILFTTGRGTPLGAPVPTVKIATNKALAEKKRGWIDFDASSGTAEGLFDLLSEVSGGKNTKNEINGYREIAIFKDGVTL